MSVERCLLCLRVPLETLLGYSQKLYDNEEMAQKVAEKAAKLLRSAYLKSPADMCGKSPRGLMAGALYVAGFLEGVRKIQDNVSQVVGVTTATLRTRYYALMELLDLEIEIESVPIYRNKQVKSLEELLEQKKELLREKKEILRQKKEATKNMNAKELYDVLTKNWSPAKIETLELLIKHGPLTITQIGTLRNVKPLHLTDGFVVMYDNGLIGFDPPNPSLKREEDITLFSYLKRKNILQNTKLFSKISVDEFNAFKKYLDEVKILKKRLKSERRSKAKLRIESCGAEDCEHNQKSRCHAPKISLIKISVSFKGQPIVICRCLEYDHPKNKRVRNDVDTLDKKLKEVKS